MAIPVRNILNLVPKDAMTTRNHQTFELLRMIDEAELVIDDTTDFISSSW